MDVKTAKKKFLSRGIGMSQDNESLFCEFGNAGDDETTVRVPIVNGMITQESFEKGLNDVSACLRLISYA